MKKYILILTIVFSILQGMDNSVNSASNFNRLIHNLESFADDAGVNPINQRYIFKKDLPGFFKIYEVDKKIYYLNMSLYTKNYSTDPEIVSYVSSFSKKNSTIIEISNVFTDKGHRKKGYSSDLLGQFCSLCKNAGYNKVILHSVTKAVDFYIKRGFSITPQCLDAQVDSFIDYYGDDTLIPMYKNL